MSVLHVAVSINNGENEMHDDEHDEISSIIILVLPVQVRVR